MNCITALRLIYILFGVLKVRFEDVYLCLVGILHFILLPNKKVLQSLYILIVNLFTSLPLLINYPIILQHKLRPQLFVLSNLFLQTLLKMTHFVLICFLQMLDLFLIVFVQMFNLLSLEWFLLMLILLINSNTLNFILEESLCHKERSIF